MLSPAPVSETPASNSRGRSEASCPKNQCCFAMGAPCLTIVSGPMMPAVTSFALLLPFPPGPYRPARRVQQHMHHCLPHRPLDELLHHQRLIGRYPSCRIVSHNSRGTATYRMLLGSAILLGYHIALSPAYKSLHFDHGAVRLFGSVQRWQLALPKAIGHRQ